MTHYCKVRSWHCLEQEHECVLCLRADLARLTAERDALQERLSETMGRALSAEDERDEAIAVRDAATGALDLETERHEEIVQRVAKERDAAEALLRGAVCGVESVDTWLADSVALLRARGLLDKKEGEG